MVSRRNGDQIVLAPASTRMEKIDRLGWAAGISFVSYGLRIGIRVSSPEVLNRLPELHGRPVSVWTGVPYGLPLIVLERVAGLSRAVPERRRGHRWNE